MLNLFDEIQKNRIDYTQVYKTCNATLVDIRTVDLSVIIPVYGRTQFNKPLIQHFQNAIQFLNNNPAITKTISITIVEHSPFAEHKALCPPWVNHIHIPLQGQFNKCLAHNIGALFANPSKYLMFHDVDTLVPPDFFMKLFFNIQGHDAVQNFTQRRLLMAGPNITSQILNNEATILNCTEGNMDVVAASSGSSGGSITCTRAIFNAIGGFETFFTEYSVEDEFFFRKLNLCGNFGFCNYPPIEMVHMWHPPSFNRVTKDVDWHFFNTFMAMDLQEKARFIKQCSIYYTEHILN